MYLLYYTKFAPPLPAQADRDAFRILCVGESTTLGYPVQGHGYPEQLEIMLRKAYPEQKIRVYNLGVCAITSTEAARHFAKNMLLYRPNLVIVQLGNNNNCPCIVPNGSRILSLASHLKTFRMAFFSCQLIYGVMSHKVQLVRAYSDVYLTKTGVLNFPNLVLGQLVQDLDAIIDTTSRLGGKIMLCNYFISPANLFLRDFATQRKVPFCDMESLHQQQGRPDWISADGWHPSLQGYAAMARKLYEAIGTHHIVDRAVSSPALPLGNRYQ